MKKEGQKVPALHPPPSFLRTRADCAFLFHSFAFDSVEEALGRLVSVSCDRTHGIRKGTRGHTLFLINSTISTEASPLDSFSSEK